ncbi:MAG: hypothetical protein ACLQO7_05030 [Candidatus Bathyarchaeia archaeon]
MIKENIQEINFASKQERESKCASHKNGMHTIRCACGFEILVLPDGKAMNRAIKNHVAEHKLVGSGSQRILAINWLEKFLTEQILIEARDSGKRNKRLNCKPHRANISHS